MAEYQSNSHRARRNEINNRRPPANRPQRRPRSNPKILSDEQLNAIKHSVVDGVVIPTGKKFIMDVVSAALNGRPSSGNISSSRNNYNKYYTDRDYITEKPVAAPKRINKKRHNGYMYTEFDYEDEAIKVLDDLRDTIDRYACTSIGDFYECIGQTGTPEDWNRGWSDLSSAYIEYHPDSKKYALHLPKAEPFEA